MILGHAKLSYYFGEEVFASGKKNIMAKTGFELCKANNPLFAKYRLNYFDDIYYMKAFKRGFKNILEILEPLAGVRFETAVKYNFSNLDLENIFNLPTRAIMIIGKYCEISTVDYFKNKGVIWQSIFFGAYETNNFKIINEEIDVGEIIFEEALGILMHGKFYETYHYLMKNR